VSQDSLPNVSQSLELPERTLPCKNSGLQFSCMSLHLIPMLVHATKEVSATMHIQHNPLPRIARPLPLMIICSHLNPFCVQFTSRPAPLPPGFSTHFLNPMVTQLPLYYFRCLCDEFLRNIDLVHLYPSWMRNPLRCESLDIFDSMAGSVQEELPNDV
jgi:hypothetical protein